MGKDKRNGKQGGKDKGVNTGTRYQEDLTYRPLQQQLKGVSVYPDCLHCQKPVSRPDLQRQGYLHDACEKKASITPERLYQIGVEQGYVQLEVA